MLTLHYIFLYKDNLPAGAESDSPRFSTFFFFFLQYNKIQKHQPSYINIKIKLDFHASGKITMSNSVYFNNRLKAAIKLN